jgi:hypothetical protein
LRSETGEEPQRVHRKPTLVPSVQGDGRWPRRVPSIFSYPDGGDIGLGFPRLLRRRAPLEHGYYC